MVSAQAPRQAETEGLGRQDSSGYGTLHLLHGGCTAQLLAGHAPAAANGGQPLICTDARAMCPARLATCHGPVPNLLPSPNILLIRGCAVCRTCILGQSQCLVDSMLECS